MTLPPIHQGRPSPSPADTDASPADHPGRDGDPANPASRPTADEDLTGPMPDNDRHDSHDGELRPAPGPPPRPPRLTRQTLTVLRALHLDPAAPRDLRYLVARTRLPRPTIRSIMKRLNRWQWTSIEQDPNDSTRARPRHLYRLTDSGVRVTAGHLDRDMTTAVFRWDHPRSPRVVATDGDLDLVLVTTTLHTAVAPAVPWPMVEVTTSLSHRPALWYATTRHRGVLLWPDPATGIVLAAHHLDVPAAPAAITFTTPDGQHRTLDGTYTQLRAQDVRAALQRWWRTHTPPDLLPCRPTPLRILPCSP